MSKKENGHFQGWRSRRRFKREDVFGKEQSAASCRAIDLGGPLPWLGRWGCWEGPCAHPFLFPSSSGVPCHCSGCGFGCARCCPDAVLCDLRSSSRLRPVNGPAEELRQAAAGCPPVSEEPDEPGEEVLLRPVSVARHQGRALGAAELQASGSSRAA